MPRELRKSIWKSVQVSYSRLHVMYIDIVGPFDFNHEFDTVLDTLLRTVAQYLASFTSNFPLRATRETCNP